jgi:L-alanine-DL-glutamate epimerase-like enolase superfamily enzyme
LNTFTRRQLLGASLALPVYGVVGAGIRVENISTAYVDYPLRTPLKFGGNSIATLTILHVTCRVRDRTGRLSNGFAAMTMANTWSFPSTLLSYQQTLAAMKTLAKHISTITKEFRQYGHPIEINRELEPEYLKAAATVQQEMRLPESIPKLCMIVTASPFDAAIHDAFGKLLNLSCYETYGSQVLPGTLDRFLSVDFRGETLDKYLSRTPKLRMPLYHLVGASDPLIAEDVRWPVNDGLPETLVQWVERDHLTHFKIKLDGRNGKWDLDRVLRTDRTLAAMKRASLARRIYSLDFNERCPNVEYLLEFLSDLRQQDATAFGRIQYIEQPTARDLEMDRSNTMHRAAKIKPIVIDESLTGLDRLLLARDMGYTGIALKACKGQTQSLLMAAAAQKYKMSLYMQDATCPGAAFVQSAGIAAHVPGVSAVEANARQYIPLASRPWERAFPGLFGGHQGSVYTGSLTGPGLSAGPKDFAI